MAGRSPLRDPTGPFEFFLGVLAIISVGIFLLPFSGTVGITVPEAWQPLVIVVDVAICVVFGADYLYRMSKSGTTIKFAREHFFQPFAAIPLNTPVISNIDVILVLIVASRFVRAANMVFGDRFVQSIFHRYSGFIAREVTEAVLVRSLVIAREVTRKGRFAKSIADALDRRRGEVHGIVEESLSKMPAWQQFQRIPGTEEIVEKTETLIVDAMLDVMRSERLNVLVANVVDDAIEDFEIALQKQHPEIEVDELGPTVERELREARAKARLEGRAEDWAR